MLENTLFVRDDVLPSYWPNGLQRFVSTHTQNFEIQKDTSTAIKIVAGPDQDAVVIGIEGAWRWTEATLTRSHPGGAAGTYDVHVTANATDVDNTPLPFSDHTDYTFTLAITASGGTPAGDITRKVGTVGWSGAAITSVTTTVETWMTKLLTVDQQAALAGTSGIPAAGNPFATKATTDALAQAVVDEAAARVTGDSNEAAARVAGDANNPSAGQKAALAGTSGVPGAGNPYATKATTDALAVLSPSSGQKDALAGTSGTPSSGNKYVTDADPRLATFRQDVKANIGTASNYPPGSIFICTDENNIEYTQIGNVWVWTRGLKAPVSLALDASNWATGAKNLEFVAGPDGWVRISGLLYHDVSSGDDTPFSASLPAALRPSVVRSVPVTTTSGVTPGAAALNINTFGTVTVYPTGIPMFYYCEGTQYKL